MTAVENATKMLNDMLLIIPLFLKNIMNIKT